MELLNRLLAGITIDGPVLDLRVGTHWTALAAATPGGARAGLASTQIVHGIQHGTPVVRDAGRLAGRSTRELAGWVDSASLTERSIGFAALNALLHVDEERCVEVNAEELVVEWGAGRNVVIVGHFPFVPRVQAAAARCSVLELNPGPGDLPASAAPTVIPEADVVAITGMALVNGTFEELASMCRGDARVLVLGATTPISPLLFDYGVEAVSGAIVTDIPAVLAAVSQGASFRQIDGKRLVTLRRG